MRPTGTDSPLDDVEFLVRSEHRVAGLGALAERPLTRAELRAATGASPSTVGRMVDEFEERYWIERSGTRYEATQLGRYVISGVTDLIDRVETERKLRDVWQLLPSDARGLDVELLSDSVVSVAEADDPYRPVNRFATLLRETGRFRFVGFELALLEPCKDVLTRRVAHGMEAEIIDPPGIARYIQSTYPEQSAETLASGNLTVLLHDDVPPYGLGLFDDRVAVSGFDPVSGTVRVLIDTDAPEVREWAEATYESYRRDARPLDGDAQ